MNKKVPIDYGCTGQLRKTKKKSKRSTGAHNHCCSDDRNRDKDRDSYEASEDEVPHVAHVPAMEYAPPVFWQQPQMSQQTQHHATNNGQRLFAAVSDPSVCGYSAVPVTYAMEPVSMSPMYRLYQPIVKPNYRLYRGRTRSSLMRMQNGPPCSNDTLRNGYSSLQENSWDQSIPIAYQNGDYASLPPNANVDNKDNRQELSSEHRRYSDPGLGPAENLPIHSKNNDDSDSAASNSSITTIDKSNKLLFILYEQMTKMKETNSQLFKEMHQAKLDLETIKTELLQIKQNVLCDYQPGMLSDVIKEIREASKVQEEAMFSKMKLLIENQQSEKFAQVDQLKSQLEQVRRENEEDKERIIKLEKEVTALRHATKMDRPTSILRGKVSSQGCSCSKGKNRPAKSSSRLGRPGNSISDSSSSDDRSNSSGDDNDDGDEDDEDDDDDKEDDGAEAEQHDKQPMLERHRAFHASSAGSCDNSINSMAASTAGPVTDL
ncbi:probable ATP-dependent helicase PF08_0048 [Copidosoma floridanum]|uniref:probable ATP-dependent helicase PF08_0048 n=1 Tax=Copidosoma floridanum TaxID=29053 RepID=UPI0006C9B305|nr:probable ATP-dependent helicase PF08_0048 [Copidosoma floridanum]